MTTRTNTGLVAAAALLAVACTAERPVDAGSGRADERTWVRFHVDDPERLRRQWEREGLEVTGADSTRGTVDVRAPKGVVERLARLEADGIRATEPLDLDRRTRNLKSYKRPGDVRALLSQAEQSYPLVATVEDLTPYGLFDGQSVLAVRLTSNAGALADKPAVLFTCQIHAGEVMTTEVCLDIVDTLSRGYGVDPAVTRWLDRAQVWVVPMVNPDGIEFAIVNDVHWRTNRDPVCPVDLNRNFERTWDACDGASTVCGSEIYRGPAPSTEPETRALSTLLASIRPIFHLDYHSHGEILAYPGGCAVVAAAAELERHARALAAVLQDDDGVAGTYRVGRLQKVVYPVSGGLMDESYEAYGTMSFLFEINREFVPDYALLREPTVERQRAAWKYLLDQAAAVSIRGRVRDATTGEPLAAEWAVAEDALLKAEASRRSTGADGRFGIAAKANSFYDFVFVAPDHRHGHVPVQLGNDGVDLDVALAAGADENHPPVAVAQANAAQFDEGQTIALDGSGSSDPDPGEVLAYLWRPTGGECTPATPATAPVASSFVPSLHGDGSCGFRLEVGDGLASDAALVQVDVKHAFPWASYCGPGMPRRFAGPFEASLQVPADYPILAGFVRARFHRFAYRGGAIALTLTSPGWAQSWRVQPEDEAAIEFGLEEFSRSQSGGTWKLEVDPNGGAGVLAGWELVLQVAGKVDPAGTVPCPDDCADLDQDGAADAACGGDDCDDRNPKFHPWALEPCGGPDLNCDGKVTECPVPPSPCPDTDGDGFCDARYGGGDCDDTDPGVSPSAQESCNGRDDDCDGETDEGCGEADKTGCGCATGSEPGGLSLLLAGLGALRRRRTRAA